MWAVKNTNKETLFSFLLLNIRCERKRTRVKTVVTKTRDIFPF